MDPTTTLITFLLQTEPSVQCVELKGSWDNFSSCYSMKRDVRRGHGQWRGCYSFKNIVCDDNALKRKKRNGGLKMGATYYYYYEIDGSIETHDPAEPWTTTCPFLPGQTVNTLIVPVEHSFRKRSASLNSMREESFRTMDPDAKFAKPRPPPSLMAESSRRRLYTATPAFHSLPEVRPPSPISSWRRFFGRKQTKRASSRDDESSLVPLNEMDQTRGLTPTESSISSQLSFESLKRSSSQPSPGTLQPRRSRDPFFRIPEDIVEEPDDEMCPVDAAARKRTVQATNLSPPLGQVEPSSPSQLGGSVPVAAASPASSEQSSTTQDPEATSKITCSPSITSSMFTSSVSPTLGEDEPPSFYDSNDDDEVLSSNDGDNYPHQSWPSMCAPEYGFSGYSLPRQTEDLKSMVASSAVQGLGSPRLVARGETTAPIHSTNLLATTIDSGLDDFVSELGWMVDVIGSKQS